MKAALRTARSVAILVATLAAFAFSFAMLRRAIGSSSPWLGLLAMVYVLGLAKVAEPLFRLKMPRSLRTVRAWETPSGAYHGLGVATFGRLLRETPLRFLNRSVYIAREQPDLADVCRQVEAAEAAHFWAALLFTPYIGYVALRGHHVEAIVFLLVQIVFNIYPVLHLRIVRGRLDRVLERERRRRVGGQVPDPPARQGET